MGSRAGVLAPSWGVYVHDPSLWNQSPKSAFDKFITDFHHYAGAAYGVVSAAALSYLQANGAHVPALARKGKKLITQTQLLAVDHFHGVAANSTMKDLARI